MGPPGSGKGTLSALCIKAFGWHQLSTGNLCRDHIQKQTETGLKMQSFINQGQLVPDEIIADMVKEWIQSQKVLPQGIIFDGYPRTRNQAELLHSLLQEMLPDSELVLIKLHVDADVVVNRILSRAACVNKDCQQIYSLMKDSPLHPKRSMTCDLCGSELQRRSDDTKETVKNRIQIYYQNEQDIIDYYVNQGICVSMINGAQAVQDVFQDFKVLAEQKEYVC